MRRMYRNPHPDEYNRDILKRQGTETVEYVMGLDRCQTGGMAEPTAITLQLRQYPIGGATTFLIKVAVNTSKRHQKVLSIK